MLMLPVCVAAMAVPFGRMTCGPASRWVDDGVGCMFVRRWVAAVGGTRDPVAPESAIQSFAMLYSAVLLVVLCSSSSDDSAGGGGA